MRNFIRITTIVLCAMLSFGCKSKEEKAEILIKDYMFKHLYDYESYESVEIKVDSCYTSLFKDSEIRYAALQVKEHFDKTKEYQEDQKDAKRTMDIWEDSWSSYSRRRYNEAREEFRTASINLSQHFRKLNENLLLIKNKSTDFEPQFIGWEATHSFRCKNRGGNFTLGNYTFIINEEFSEIIDVIDEDDEDNETIFMFIEMAIETPKEDLEERIKASSKTIKDLERM